MVIDRMTRAINMIRKLMKDTRVKATGIRRRLYDAWIDSFPLDLDFQQSTFVLAL
jgi:hypothetical protein